MAIASSTFSKHEISEFLRNTNNLYAASCWSLDIESERPDHTTVAKWFSRHFLDSNRAQYMFRLVECHCTQYWEMEENA